MILAVSMFSLVMGILGFWSGFALALLLRR